MKQKDTELRKHFDNSDELCEYMADLCDGCTILAFSTGKDSVVAWLKLRRYFRKIVPYYLYPIPGGPLSFTERAIKYYEDWFGCHILRLPHPSVHRMLNDFVDQAPENLRIIEEARLPNIDYEDINALVRATDPELEDAYQASGVRSADSIVRRQSMLKHGQINHKARRWYPAFDYLKADMIRELDAAQIALPIDYEWFGRTFDGIDHRFTSVVKEKSPEDFERIKLAFPLVEMDILRQQYRREHHEGGTA